MNKIEFENITISRDVEPLVIPEIGINHGGDLFLAKQMVDAAYNAGAKCIKHQTHIVDDEMSSYAKKVIPGNSDESIYNIMKKAALTCDEEYDLKLYVESKNMTFISTPFSRAAADRLYEFGIEIYKIGSGECNNYPLVEHIAKFGKPMIVSTGMNDIKSVGITVDILRKYKIKFVLLHTTNLYPTPPELVRLGAMIEMKKTFNDCMVGLSDHTLNNNACIAATALGAVVLERHFTDTMEREGPDISCSMDESALAELIIASKEVAKMRYGTKDAAIEEAVTMNFAFATVVAIKPIKRGDIFTEDNIWVKRPGVGEFSAKEYKDILGKTALTDIDVDTHLNCDMVKK